MNTDRKDRPTMILKIKTPHDDPTIRLGSRVGYIDRVETVDAFPAFRRGSRAAQTFGDFGGYVPDDDAPIPEDVWVAAITLANGSRKVFVYAQRPHGVWLLSDESGKTIDTLV